MKNGKLCLLTENKRTIRWKTKFTWGGGGDFYSSTSFSSHFNSTCTWTCICSLNHYDTRATCFLQSPNFKSSAQWWRDDTCDFALWIGSFEQFNPLVLFDHVLPEHFLFTFFFLSHSFIRMVGHLVTFMAFGMWTHTKNEDSIWGGQGVIQISSHLCSSVENDRP